GRPRAHRLLGQRRGRCARSADDNAGLRDLRPVRHGERRRVPHRLHLGHDRRAQGHHAFPPRHACDLRQLRAPRAARRCARPLHRLPPPPPHHPPPPPPPTLAPPPP